MKNNSEPGFEQSGDFQNSPTTIVPVIEEQLHIEKQLVETGKVHISKKVIEEVYDEDLSILKEDVVVERKPIGEYIEGEVPGIRLDGDTTIIPVLKEIIVKRLLLVEELHITKRINTLTVSIHEVLRKEEITIKRTDSPASADQNNP